MKLYFLRHGEAGMAASDDERELTPRGQRDVATIGRRCQAELAAVDTVLVSPIRRAQQTAALACEAAGRPPEWQTVDWLVHETPVQQALQALGGVSAERVWLVGHQPLASLLVERLSGERLPVGTANLVVLEGEAALPGWMHVLRVETPD